MPKEDKTVESADARRARLEAELKELDVQKTSLEESDLPELSDTDKARLARAKVRRAKLEERLKKSSDYVLKEKERLEAEIEEKVKANKAAFELLQKEYNPKIIALREQLTKTIGIIELFEDTGFDFDDDDVPKIDDAADND